MKNCFLIVVQFLVSVDCKTYVHFKNTHQVVEESDFKTVNVILSRIGDLSKDVFVTCQLPQPAVDDFYSLSVATSFINQSDTAECQFFVKDDEIPEGNETYPVTLSLRDVRNVDLITPNKTFITILPNDDPYGCVAFTNLRKYEDIEEPQTQPLVLTFEIKRHGGRIGNASVFWQLSPIEDLKHPDFSAVLGFVNFLEDEESKILQLDVLPDELPEPREIYMLRLMNASGGVCIWDNSSEIEIRIKENDAPIRFKMSSVVFAEPQKQMVSVLRGIDTDGTRIGPIGEVATVQYKTVAGTAHKGVDYIHKEGVITFEVGTTKKDLEIVVLSDPKPELMENFTVLLTSVSSNVILSKPKQLEIMISKNDHPHGLIMFSNESMSYVVSEDSLANVNISVIRLKGLYGNVIVTWTLESTKVDPAVVFKEVTGFVRFPANQSEGQIVLAVLKNDVPFEAVSFKLVLTDATGGANILPDSNGNLPSVEVIVKDSDDAYGVFKFTDQNANLILSSTPRRIESKLRRSGGALSDVEVSYSISYYHKDSSIPLPNILIKERNTLLMKQNEKELFLVAEIRNDVFLKAGSYFILKLDAVNLTKPTLILPSSPSIGMPDTMFVNITTHVANGEIGFFGVPISIQVPEPMPSSKMGVVNLKVMRDGTASSAKVFWRLMSDDPSFTKDDASPMSGFVMFQKGSDEVNITLKISSDQIPELDEIFFVELYNTSGRNEKLRNDATKAFITIRKNDNPGGVIEFLIDSPIIIKESSNTVLYVQRYGGVLEPRTVEVKIEKGEDDFSPFNQLITFNRGESKKRFYLYPIDDNKPELSETFSITMHSVMGAVLGNKTQFAVTILESDDPYGLISFSNDPANINQRIGESPNFQTEVKYQVSRSRGTFGNIQVFWKITSSVNGENPSVDLSPTSGVMVLSEGQNTNTFSVYVERDMIPENDEEFKVNITNVTGGASLVAPSYAKLTINANDFPVTISPLTVNVDEGNATTLKINLNKTFSQSIQVSVKTIPLTAGSNDYVSFDKNITFLPGEKEHSIRILTLNDEIPELDETFTVQITSTTGDTVLWENHSANIIINANDDPNGVFEFLHNQNKVVSEGETVKLSVMRLKGLYGNVSLTWQAMNESDFILDTFEISENAGTLKFIENQSIGEIEFFVKKDGMPELNETFYVRLLNVSGGLSRIGNQKWVKILILSNDYPNGLFVVADDGTTLVYGEDFYTEGNVTLQRLKGSIQQAKVIWEIHKSHEDIPIKIWDLFLRGNDSHLLEVTGREFTSTKALRFFQGSCLTVPILRQPRANDLSNGFSYGVFFMTNTSSNFTLLRKTLNTSTLLMISIESWIKTTLKIMVLHENSHKQTISVNLSANVLNKKWHSVFVTFSMLGNVIVYLDGDKIITKSVSLFSPIFKLAGEIFVGCDEHSHDIHLQDFRIYPEPLNAKKVTYLSNKQSAFSLFNGEVTFFGGEIKKSFPLNTLNNDIPEPNMFYTLKILDVIDNMEPRDRAVISKENGTKEIKVLKSDYANGVFRLIEETCENDLSESAVKPRNISIEREKGLFDKVMVAWEIKNSDGYIAKQDFANATGQVLFVNNQSKQNFFIYPLDDDIPEGRESFVLKLVSVQSGDDFLPLSSENGASINVNESKCLIGISENDFPYGVFQVMDVVPSSVDYITPLSHALDVKVTEEQSMFHAFIVRAQGLTGTVSVEWKTEGGTAVGGIDYVENVGSVNLKPGQRSARLTIQILDNPDPELTKEFRIVLRNPAGGAVLGKASFMNIHIRPSDNAMGVFSFVETNVTAAEGVPLNLTIHRTGGTLGDVDITWKILNGRNDFLNESGVVLMRRRENITTISLFPVTDKIPELVEVFQIMIFNLSDGAINKMADKVFIQILPNDYPYGLFNFRETHKSIPEGSRTLRIGVVRTKGLTGAVRVHYNVSQTFNAIENKDFELEDTYVDFNEGDKEKFILVNIFNDNIPEIDESFQIQLINCTLLNTDSINMNMIGKNNSITVTINGNDFAHGVLEFESSVVNITEEFTNPVVNVSRKQGLFGKISFRFMVKPNSAALGIDFTVNTLEVVMADGQQFAELPIFIVEDTIPEFQEDFTVSILPDTITGGAVGGIQLSCRYVILESDFPYGLIGFSSNGMVITASEPSSLQTSTIVVDVLREGGVHGATQILWKMTPSDTDDVFPTQGRIGFLTGEKMQQITINVKPDDIPEFNETFKIELMNVTIGKASINSHKQTVQLIILPNDDPYGVINFSHKNLTVIEEKLDTVVFIPIERSRGWFGDLKIYYRTQEIEISVHHKADGNSDFNSITDDSIILRNGSIYKQLRVVILNDTIPELDETFQVKLVKVELIGLDAQIENQPKIGTMDIVNITITGNDQPYGLMQLSLDSNVKLGTDGTYLIQEPEFTDLPMQFTIIRHGGMFNVVMVSWRLAGGYTVSPGLDISGVDGATITFQPNERRKSFTITINQDKIPEDDEMFTIELYNPTNGAVLDKFHSQVTIAISGNDIAGGIIGFRAGSLSVNANEGQQIKLFLDRTHSFLGHVVIQWRINGLNAEEDFSTVTGYTSMQPGQKISEITFNVKIDSKPEPDEQFTVELLSVNTTGISEFGAAILSRTSSTAYIILRASNDPHGIVEFSSTAQPVHVAEDSGEVQLLLVRRAGKIGLIQIFYEVQPFGNNSLAQASINHDIQVAKTSVYIPDQMDSVQIQIPIVNDNIPEVDEGFRIKLTSVHLINSPSNTSSVPTLGKVKAVDVIIDANDGTRGELMFAPHSVNPNVEEYDHALNLTVIRSLGAFGDVYCFYYLNRLNASVEDFYINGGVMLGGPAKLVFKDGVTKVNITVFIKDDTLTEDLEQFEIGLTIQNAIGNGGVAIGNPSRTTISILPNDDANGIIQFKQQSQPVFLDEPNEIPGAKSSHTFVVERIAGWFGHVLVGWKVKNHSKSDVTPLSGILEFEPYDREESFDLTVIEDALPELQRNIFVEINVVSGGAALGTPSKATVVIAASDYPYGLFSFKSYPELITDESKVVLKVAVVREGGSYGNTTVNVKTTSGSANSIYGNDLKYAIDYSFNITDIYASCQINAYDNDFLLVSSTKSIEIYIWKGTFLKVKEYHITNITKISSSQIGHKHLVAMSNTSHVLVYSLEKMFDLKHIQTIQDSGITDSLLFEGLTTTFIGFTIGKDASGETVKLLQLFKWNGYQFTQHPSSLQTFQGQTFDFVSVNNTGFLVVGNRFNRIANSFKTKSFVYLLLNDGTFQLYGEMVTHDVKEVKFFKMHNQLYVGIVNGGSPCEFFIHTRTHSTRFELVQNFGDSCNSMNMISLENEDFMIVGVKTRTQVYKYDPLLKLFIKEKVMNFELVPKQPAVLLTRRQDGNPISYFMIENHSTNQLAWLVYQNSTSDFVQRSVTLEFDQHVTELDVFFTIFDDHLPEPDEFFYVNLSNSTHGSSLSPVKSTLKIMIMANDNAYGRIEFSNSSLHRYIEEEDYDTVFTLQLVRKYGSYGVVTVHFAITNINSMYDSQSEIYPKIGSVQFATKEVMKDISLYLKGDSIPELAEQFAITLTGISTEGVPDNLGASINYMKDKVLITIPPNDDPYGVFSWKHMVQVSTEYDETNSTVLLVITREKGAFGEVMVFYETYVTNPTGLGERAATPFIDFIPVSGNITFGDGMREQFVFINITHRGLEKNLTLDEDGMSDFNEVFYVNLTNAELVSVTNFSMVKPTLDFRKTSVQVVITDAVQKNGVVQFKSAQTIMVDEDMRALKIPLERSLGSDGMVAVYFDVVFQSADKLDVKPHFGTVSFNANETLNTLDITIQDDDIPELAERFLVILTKPVGGVVIGSNKKIQVEIKENDYPYGLFSISTDSRQIKTFEGDQVSILIERLYGSKADVSVIWHCDSKARNEITVTSGIITFQEGQKQKRIVFNIIDDSIPEIEIVFTCSLTNTTNGGELSQHNQSRITISASDKPFGVFELDKTSRELFVAEGGNFTIRVIRDVGQQASVCVGWNIQNVFSSVNNTATTFSLSSGVLKFPPGVREQLVNIQVLADKIPEEAERYRLFLHSPTGGGELNPNKEAITTSVTVKSSGNPYGIFRIKNKKKLSVDEDVGSVNIVVERYGGSIGTVFLKFSINGHTAMPKLDYSPAKGELVFGNGDVIKTITVDVINDDIPEVQENFLISLDHVTLNKSLSSNETSVQANTPPLIDESYARVNVTITENDDPYGMIEFVESVMIVHEWQLSVDIPVVRSGGLYDSSSVEFTFTPISATYLTDFSVDTRPVLFSTNQNTSFIRLTLIDDVIPEDKETFLLYLKRVVGKARLGNHSKLTVIIETSDNPYGLFGFYNTSNMLRIQNPTSAMVVRIPVSRRAGTKNLISIEWEITRVQTSSSHVTEDLTPKKGTILFQDKEDKGVAINITILPYGGPQEAEERFELSLKNADGGASIDTTASKVTIIIGKKGFPSGLFAIQSIQPGLKIDEPLNGMTTIKIVVYRQFGRVGSVHVKWSISSSTGSITDDIHYARPQILTFADSQTVGYILINITADDHSELEEEFHVSLVSADQGAEIDENESTAVFSIKANGDPHGVFSLMPTKQIIHVNDVNMTRTLNIHVTRTAGLMDMVSVSLSVEHVSMATTNHNVNFLDGQSEASLIVPISDNAFLEFPSRFSLRLLEVRLANATKITSPIISSTNRQVLVEVPEHAANSIVQITNSSLFVSVNQIDQAVISVERIGLYGNIRVQWNSGYPSNMINKPTNQEGEVQPRFGVIQMQHNLKMTTFTVSAIIPSEVTQSYHYAVHLNTNLVSSPQFKHLFKVGENRYSVIEVHGVVRIALHSQDLLVLEGQPANVVIERMFSTTGTIRVTYHTKSFVGLNAATPDKDFTPITSYVDLDDGQFKKTIQINTIDDIVDPQPESKEIFYVELKSVVVLSSRKSVTSPRLSTELTSMVNIQDNDEPYGIISISEKSRTISVDETAGSVSVVIERNGGTYSTASVRVITLGGGETWNDEITSDLSSSSTILQALHRRSEIATSTSDYQPVYTEITFVESQVSPAVRQQQTVNIKILKDGINEPIEQLLVLILNATGGAKIFEPHAFSIISINANGLYNGQVGFQSKTAILDEDAQGFVDLVVIRTGQALQNITVTWSASSPVSDLVLSDQIMNTNGQITFPANVKEETIKIFARKDSKPEFASFFYVKLTTVSSGAVLEDESSRMTITIKESDYPVGRIRFASQSSYVVVEVGTRSVELVVERENGTRNATTVSFHTVVLAGKVQDGGVTMNPASLGSDFFETNGKVYFAIGQVKALITVRLGDITDDKTTYPRVFNVTLSDPTNGAVLHDTHKTSRIIITRTGVTGSFLKLRSSTLSLPLSDADIFVILTRALDTVRRYDLLENDQQILLNIIADILNHKSSLSAGNRALTSQSQDILLDIYDALMSNSRADTKGNSYWIKSLETSAFSFLNDVSCPTILSFSKSNFDMQVLRNNKSSMNGYTYTEDSDYFRYPENLFLSTSSSMCTDVQFTSLNTRHLFSGDDVLNDKVLSSSIQSGLSSNTNFKIVYRINAPTNRITPNKVTCVIWEYPTVTAAGYWSTTNCQVKRETKTYVECECDHLSEYAVLARSDNRTGYEIYFFISCFVTVGACLLALMAHHCCAIEKTFTASLLMHMFFSVMVTNGLFVIGAYVSPDLLDHKTRCGVLGLFLHYFFLTQFTNIFVQSCNLWRILIMNDEHTYRKSVPFFLIGWALPVVIIIGYIFITYAVWSWNFNMMYADVHGNGDLCFIPHGYAAFSVAAVPVLLILVAVFVVLVQAYQVTPQWKYYDDVFRGRYNIKEVRHLFFLFFLISVTWLFAGLHITYGHLWMIITFTMLNGLAGLYIFVIYVILRNQMRSMFKGKYSVQQPPPKERMELRQMVHGPVESLKHTKKPVSYEDHMDDWSNVQISRISPHPHATLRTVTPVSQVSRHLYTAPTTFGRQGNNNESYDDDEDGNSTDFDDLIFALKSGGKYSPSVTEEVLTNEHAGDNNVPPSSSVSEQFAVRRIQMGDTHL